MLASCAAWLRARASVSLSAALGGRRINKKIYCAKHDSGYSSLVTELASQAGLFNAMLGVVHDHSKDVKENTAYHAELHTQTNQIYAYTGVFFHVRAYD